MHGRNSVLWPSFYVICNMDVKMTTIVIGKENMYT